MWQIYIRERAINPTGVVGRFWFFGCEESDYRAEGVGGGAIGALIQGFQRAAFSNEAGIGSASIAHSAVKTNEPVTEGLVALLEPFIDTVIVCTMTALVIVITGTIDGEGVWQPLGASF